MPELLNLYFHILGVCRRKAFIYHRQTSGWLMDAIFLFCFRLHDKNILPVDS